MSQCCRESGASGLAQCRAATHLQFLRDTESVKHHKMNSAPALLHFKNLCAHVTSRDFEDVSVTSLMPLHVRHQPRGCQRGSPNVSRWSPAAHAQDHILWPRGVHTQEGTET